MKKYFSSYDYRSITTSIHLDISKDGKFYINGRCIEGANIWLWDTLKVVLATHGLSDNPGIISRKYEAKKALEATEEFISNEKEEN